MHNGNGTSQNFSAWIRSLTTGLGRLLGARSWRSLPRSFRKAATRENLVYSVKVGLAAILAYGLAELSGLQHSLWAPMSAIIVMQVHMSASLEISFMRLVGTTAGAVLGVGTSLALPAEPWALVVALMVVGSVCAFLELWEPRFRMAGITAVLILFMGNMPGMGGVVPFAVDRVLEMGLGILSALLVSALILPASATAQLNASLSRQYRQAAAALESMTEAFLQGQRSVSPRLLDKLFADIAGNAPAFDKVRNYELFHSHRDYPHLSTLIRVMDEIRTYLAGMLDALNSDSGEAVELDFAEELRKLSEAAAQGLRWVAAQSQNEPAPLQPAIEAGAVRFSALRSQGFFRDYDHPKVMQVFAFYNSLCHMAQAVAMLQIRMEHENAEEQDGAHPGQSGA